MKFQDIVRQKRKELGLTQEQAARKGGDYQKPKLGWQVSGATLLEAMNVMKDPR